ncbi:uncharacterized protein L201_007438 [Kwoniella dendrophila CBS 6074]|uniref:F-box domain-containing protein n=1 Tax=Kwoniella dendrophila CBS 6074 TaxID=1295534 RepID=A0AAX4K6P8_9TREE
MEPVLSTELWEKIIGHCTEKGDEGVFTPQRTLATCLRVCKTWYLLASPYLYASPVVQHISNFLSGADKPISEHLSGILTHSTSSSQELYLQVLQEGNTKLPLLHQVQNLKFYALDLPENRENFDFMKISMDTIDKSGIISNMLHNLTPFTCLTPRLENIQVNSHLFPFGLDEKSMTDLVSKNCSNLSTNFFTVLKPKYWCEYDSPPNVRLSESPKDLSRTLTMIENGYIPKISEFHTSLTEDEPPTIHWGTTNRVSIREKMDVRKYMFPRVEGFEDPKSELEPRPKAQHQDDIVETGSQPESDSEDSGCLAANSADPEQNQFNNNHNNGEWPVEAVGDMDLDCWVDAICEIIQNSRLRLTGKPNLNHVETIDSKTKLHVYGIEKFLTIAPGYAGGPSYIDETTTIIPKIKPEDVDLSSFRGIKECNFTSEQLELRKSIHQSSFKKMESTIREKLKINSSGNWIKTNRKAPEIKLFLAIEHPGCMSCGQGKNDIWKLDCRPRPPAREDDSDWTDEYDEDDDDDFDSDDYPDVDDLIEYDDDDIYDMDDDDDGFLDEDDDM